MTPTPPSTLLHELQAHVDAEQLRVTQTPDYHLLGVPPIPPGPDSVYSALYGSAAGSWAELHSHGSGWLYLTMNWRTYCPGKIRGASTDEVSRNGDTITLTVFRQYNRDKACTQVSDDTHHTIRLPGIFDHQQPDLYSITVNGETIEIVVIVPPTLAPTATKRPCPKQKACSP
jgi:hypothetical protein